MALTPVIHTGDCLDVMPTLAAGSIDAIVTDPPYNLTDVGRGFQGRGGTIDSRDGSVRSVAGHGGFMGQTWDGTGVAFRPETWEAALRVAKLGAYLLAFGGTRTVHRMTCAIEDAGWVIRDVLVWAYAQGFPKSRASLKPAWEPIVMARKPGASSPLQIDAARIGWADENEAAATNGKARPNSRGQSHVGSVMNRPESPTVNVSPLGRWPANVVLTATEDGRAIFDGDVPGVVGAQNDTIVLCQTCSARSADASSTASAGIDKRPAPSLAWQPDRPSQSPDVPFAEPPSQRRGGGTAASPAPTWVGGSPASMGNASTLTGKRESEPELSEGPKRTASAPSLDPAFLSGQPANDAEPLSIEFGTTTTTPSRLTCGRCASPVTTSSTPASIGGYSRFFLISKADRAEREPMWGSGLEASDMGDFRSMVCNVCESRFVLNGRTTCGHDDHRLERGARNRLNGHPTVKPLDLMRHLVRLVTPPGGTVLDPFLGSGTTALACEMEGFPWVGIEREPEYVKIAEARLNGTQRGMGLPA